jgi:hypothetical protein
MHRFAVNYYKKPVAVNDLGYVSYKNNNYVLDLWGLASIDALKYRKTNHSSEWVNKLTKSNDIELAMIYEDWFKSISDDWIKIGELHLGKKKVTPAHNKVAFFAMNQNAYVGIVAQLHRFIKTLPHDVEFIFEENSG